MWNPFPATMAVTRDLIWRNEGFYWLVLTCIRSKVYWGSFLTQVPEGRAYWRAVTLYLLTITMKLQMNSKRKNSKAYTVGISNSAKAAGIVLNNVLNTSCMPERTNKGIHLVNISLKRINVILYKRWRISCFLP